MKPNPLRTLSAPTLIWIVMLSLALPFQQAVGADRPPASAGRHWRFEFGGQIKDAVDELAKQLAMTDSQQRQLTVLMEQRMKSTVQLNIAARESFRNNVNLLLSDVQRKTISWPDTHSWKWETALLKLSLSTKIPDLTTAQKHDIKALWVQYGGATWDGIIRAQNIYENALNAILTILQRGKLAAIEADDSTTHIPNNEGQGSD